MITVRPPVMHRGKTHKPSLKMEFLNIQESCITYFLKRGHCEERPPWRDKLKTPSNLETNCINFKDLIILWKTITSTPQACKEVKNAVYRSKAVYAVYEPDNASEYS